MVNYGNSKALVAVADSHHAGLNSLSAISSKRPRNAVISAGTNSMRNAWGSSGEFIEGQALAIEYNHDALQDRPLPEDIQEEQ